MKVYFGQIYIEPGVTLPLTRFFQHRLSEEITALVSPSSKFLRDYGSDFKLIIRISAKKTIEDNEARGPTVFKRTKDVEYTIFLPFEVINRIPDVMTVALRYLFKGICAVFESLEIDPTKVIEKQESLIEAICSDPTMFHPVQRHIR